MTTTLVVTGASSGLGAAIAQSYAEPGTVLGLIGRNTDRLEKVATICRQRGALVEVGSIDVRNTAGLTKWLQDFDDCHAIEILVANAGIANEVSPSGARELLAAISILDVNLNGAVATVMAVADRMRGRRRGQLVLMSSLAGIRPLPDMPVYGASKAGLISYGNALRGQLRHDGVKVTVICPGFVETPMSAQHRGPRPLLMTTDQAVRHIRKAIERGASMTSFPMSLALGLHLLALLPAAVADRIIDRFNIK